MKVLQINTLIDHGSTGRITRELYDYLERNDHECLIAYGRFEKVDGYRTVQIGGKFEQFFHRLYSHVFDRHGFGSYFATKKFIRLIDEYNPDVIQLHNLHGAYINVNVLFSYLSSKNIPIVWLLHDQWSISGHSTNFNLNEDGTIPTRMLNRAELKQYPKSYFISQFTKNYQDKKRLFTSVKNMTVITPSEWLKKIIDKSYLNEYPILTINNGIDISQFNIDCTQTKRLTSQWVSENKIVLLGVASTWNKEKGIDDFVKLSVALPKDKYQIVLVGVNEELAANLPDNIICINRTNSIEELRDIYNASDILLNPTYFDNFPTVNIEALSCGTPVITYDTGGSSESLDDKTGSVIPQGNIDELIREIYKWGRKTEMTMNNCRERAINLYSKEDTYNKYMKLYKQLIEMENDFQ